MIVSTAYNMLAFAPTEFIEKPEVQEYENQLENISAADEWTRTQYYWSNNLKVVGVYAIGTPSYVGFNSTVANSYRIGMSLTYIRYRYGSESMLIFLAMVFVHGLLELTGIYLIAAVSLRAAWNFWKGLGSFASIMDKEGNDSLWELTKKEIFKHRHAIKLLLLDFIVLFAIGSFLVFLAAPIEAYVSPAIGQIFWSAPVAAAVFLAAVGLFYALIFARGFNRMREDLKLVWNVSRLASKKRIIGVFVGIFVLLLFLPYSPSTMSSQIGFVLFVLALGIMIFELWILTLTKKVRYPTYARRKCRPVQLPLFVFVLLFLLMLIRLMF